MEFVKDYISSLNINDTVVLACSYGPDSMCLLDILSSLGIRVVVAHVNHKLREESDMEYADLETYCKENNYIFEGYIIDNYPKGNVEAIARDIRYKFFESILEKYNSKYLFTAHHGDDLIETILMRICRGSSFKGYAGISIINKLGSYFLVRPLLNVTKSDIISYNFDKGIPYAIDKTNLENVHTRNIFRNNILPELKLINSDVHRKFLKFSDSINNYYNYVNEEVNSYKHIFYKNRCLDINDMKMLPIFILKLLLESILLDIYGDDIVLINDKHVNLIINLINSDKCNSMIDLPLNYVCYKFYNIIDIRVREKHFNYDYVMYGREISINDGYITLLDDSDVVKSNYLIRLNSLDVKLPLHIRNRCIGDKIELKNGTKKVGEIFSEAKLSKLDRDVYPIVTDDNNRILWIPGIKKSKYDRQINGDYDIIAMYIKKERKHEEEK